MPVLLFGLGPLGQIRQLVRPGRHLDVADRFEVGVDPVVVERLAHPAVVLYPEHVEMRDLVGEVPDPVQQAVRERRVEEAAVAPGGAVPHDVGLTDHHPQRLRALEQLDRGPQPGETAADDGDVGLLVALQR